MLNRAVSEWLFWAGLWVSVLSRAVSEWVSWAGLWASVSWAGLWVSGCPEQGSEWVSWAGLWVSGCPEQGCEQVCPEQGCEWVGVLSRALSECPEQGCECEWVSWAGLWVSGCPEHGGWGWNQWKGVGCKKEVCGWTECVLTGPSTLVHSCSQLERSQGIDFLLEGQGAHEICPLLPPLQLYDFPSHLGRVMGLLGKGKWGQHQCRRVGGGGGGPYGTSKLALLIDCHQCQWKGSK